MIKVYSNESSLIVNHIKNLIEAQGISVMLKNEFAQGAVGEIAAFDAWPELWVTEERDAPRALEIVESAQQPLDAPDWFCHSCGEQNASSFELCWNCQKEHPLD